MRKLTFMSTSMEWEYVELEFEIGEVGHKGNIGSGLLFYI